MIEAKEELLTQVAYERSLELIEKFGRATAILVAEEFLSEYEVRDGMRIDQNTYWLRVWKILKYEKV